MVSQRINLKDCQITITSNTSGGHIVGGAEELSCKIERENTIAVEAGSYLPVEIIDGTIKISGSLKRAFIDVDLLNTIFPNQSLAPSFDITGEITSGKTPARKITLTGVKFKSVDINGFALTEYARNSMEFDALGWKFTK